MADDLSKRIRNVLITGGTRGIGLAIANEFLNLKNYNIFVTCREENINYPLKYNYLKCDLSDIVSLKDLTLKISDLNIDILINCAGINKIGNIENYSSQDFLNLQNINVLAPFELCKAVIPNMKKQKWGRIVNISSIFGKISKEYRAAYSASKFALDGMTISMAAELAEYGVLANCVAPGFIDTDLTRTILGEDGINKLSSQVPMKRLGKPQEVAKLVVWLSSDENTYLTGQNIAIDGGFSRV